MTSERIANDIKNILDLSKSVDEVEPMKWAEFLTVMNMLDFKYRTHPDSEFVHFDPPDPTVDLPISLEKPGPGHVLNPKDVRSLGERLRKQYHWVNDDLVRKLTQ